MSNCCVPLCLRRDTSVANDSEAGVGSSRMFFVCLMISRVFFDKELGEIGFADNGSYSPTRFFIEVVWSL